MQRGYRMLVSDIDGTLTDERGQISSANRGAVRKLIASGFPVTLATGRSRQDAVDIVCELGIELPVVIHNGAGIYDYKNGTYLLQQHLSRGEAVVALNLLERTGLAVFAYADEYVYIGKWESALADYLLPGCRVRYAPLRRVIDRQPLRKLCVTGPAPDCAAAFLDLRRRDITNHLNVHLPDPHCIEVLPKGVDKAGGLAVLLRSMGIDFADIVAIGNGANDIRLLQRAGTGIAVADAVPELLAIAKHVTTTSTKDALAQVITEFFGEQLRIAA